MGGNVYLDITVCVSMTVLCLRHRAGVNVYLDITVCVSSTIVVPSPSCGRECLDKPVMLAVH